MGLGTQPAADSLGQSYSLRVGHDIQIPWIISLQQKVPNEASHYERFLLAISDLLCDQGEDVVALDGFLEIHGLQFGLKTPCVRGDPWRRSGIAGRPVAFGSPAHPRKTRRAERGRKNPTTTRWKHLGQWGANPVNASNRRDTQPAGLRTPAEQLWP